MCDMLSTDVLLALKYDILAHKLINTILIFSYQNVCCYVICPMKAYL